MPTGIITDLIFLFFLSTYIFHLFYSEHVLFYNKDILQKSEVGEVGKPGTMIFMCVGIHSSFIKWN